jgi:hypothetical protein
MLVLGICGGVTNLTRSYLNRTGKYDEFRFLVAREHTLTFPTGLQGEDLNFVLPNAELPSDGSTFTQCKSQAILF